MKNIIKILGISVFIFSLCSCSEEAILDLSPVNNISIEDAFSSPSLIESSMNGVYNAAAIGQYNSTNPNGGRGYIWGAAFVEQDDCRGEDVVNTATFYQLTYTATYDATTANNVYYWIDGYRLINRCNLMIEGVTTAAANGIISQSDADNYIGQSKFLRAITHFELLNHFARTYSTTSGATHLGIPYREVGINTQNEIDSELLKPRNTVAECYAKILADLDDAEAKISNTQLTKASKDAAIAFKTRVYLHKRDWNNVILEGNKLTAYTLTAEPDGVFDNNYANTESIFSILHASTNNPGVNAALASQYNRRRLVCISPIIWRDPSWLVDDKRRNETYDSDNNPDGMVFTFSGRKYTAKYRDGVNYTDAAPVIRYAEVLLNMAEAYARKTSPDLTESLNRLNTVRNRSLANPTTQAYTASTFADATELVGAILKERRIEFLMEGKRWGDIHRLQGDNLFPIDGIPAKIANGNPAAATFTLGTPYTGPLGVDAIPGNNFKFLWPIPQVELNSNPTLATQQNPGW
ncbi:RagB/SusD family nutrient uptake outer membrane protein [Flavobacterium jejuense]|uniref:RagB/SusD family nutrient uptake outer membrane protein n=1 Tax=Flavobacterium jejuense TaxID=1544455 RepID=A0ABX0ITI7_9FLAO|nr:RagB/SusD family nutrient uptake outer membrane protein [Flavobacterium jejuense]NHN27107.1 RagB/SusD family nutrient uptake outer membrane protein [Flavobacterium jejuense]